MTKQADRTAGVVPAINDVVAGVILVGVYLVRIGYVAEGMTGPWYLAVMTDVVVPLLAAVWLLVVPTVRVLAYVRE
jgi:hypothetical protein